MGVCVGGSSIRCFVLYDKFFGFILIVMLMIMMIIAYDDDKLEWNNNDKLRFMQQEQL